MQVVSDDRQNPVFQAPLTLLSFLYFIPIVVINQILNENIIVYKKETNCARDALTR